MDMGQYFTAADQFSITPALMLVLFACGILLFLQTIGKMVGHIQAMFRTEEGV